MLSIIIGNPPSVMTSIPLNIHFVKENVVRSLKFPIHSSISEILNTIAATYKCKIEDHGLFQVRNLIYITKMST